MDEPKTLRFKQIREERQSGLCAPHITSLTRFVEELRQLKGADFCIPYFDPHDGGVNAKVLFLLEAPGPKAKGSGFVSRDNPDETAKNIWTMSREAGLNRTDSVIWNVCPWYVGTPSRIRAVKVAEVRESENALRSLLVHLAELRCVALVGRKAQLTRKTIQVMRPEVQIVDMAHPSPMFVNRKPGNRMLVLDGFRQVERLL